MAGPVNRNDFGAPVVALAADSAPYTDPPEQQKDAYHVYELEEWIYTVFNSITSTLQANGEGGVCFASPDGGSITIERNGVSVYLSPKFGFDYKLAYDTNHLNPDLIDLILATPQAKTTVLGISSFMVIFPVEDMTIEGGTLTIYDENNQVYRTVDLSDPDLVRSAHDQESTQLYTGYANFKEWSAFELIVSDWIEEPGTYSVHLDAGAFRAPDGRENKEIKPEKWNFTVVPYGIVNCTIPEGTEGNHVGQT